MTEKKVNQQNEIQEEGPPLLRRCRFCSKPLRDGDIVYVFDTAEGADDVCKICLDIIKLAQTDAEQEEVVYNLPPGGGGVT